MSAPLSRPMIRSLPGWVGRGLGVLAIFFTAMAMAGAVTAPATQPPGSAGAPATRSYGPDVVILKDLVDQYEAVPFDHKSHAQMADMWDGCVTCHHLAPDAATRPATAPAGEATAHVAASQNDSNKTPACRHCHSAAESAANIRMPALKGAYHRQCLNCHREWAGENACVACHKARDGAKLATPAPSRDDILGRMHPPTTMPTTRIYKVRFTPADGQNVLFRHDEHVKSFGLKCVDCHHRDSCSHCHEGDKPGTAPAVVEMRTMKPGTTWRQSHEPCIGCHQQSHCRTCHYKDDQPAPAAFVHVEATGQQLDANHIGLTCRKCHAVLRSRSQITCGQSECHPKAAATITYPLQRPGRFVPKAVELKTDAPPHSMPTTRVVVVTSPSTAPAPRYDIRGHVTTTQAASQPAEELRRIAP